MWWIWLIAAGVFFVLEIFTVGFLIFWLGIASILAMIVSFITSSIAIQTLVFVVASIIMIFFTRPLINKFLKIDKNESLPTNVYRLIGKSGIVVEDIDPIKFTGKVKVQGEYWSAISSEPIAKNSQIIVSEINGVKLKVTERK